ncbi:hypothetical protein TI39_contig298g00046 [Zymoseptoria brevis]|uniref:Uncharacterized protein n=1 Tax=Zymoseptoria brevis TaxID=1047168 RepID=A0A0F4GYD8_9PEZI|nr:hypothetical protein TI39_contig298g00046 [Zymoseptoria brevis]
MGRVFTVGGLSSQIDFLPPKEPVAFFADLTDAMAATSSQVVRTIQAACPAKCPLPRVLEFPTTWSEKRIFHVHFRRAPGFMRLYAPVHVPEQKDPFMATFTPLRPKRT